MYLRCVINALPTHDRLLNCKRALWMVDATFIFILLFFYLILLSFRLASIHLFHPTHGLFWFILCYLSRACTFSIMFIPHCKYFFLSSCTRKLAHNAVNTRSQSLMHRKCTCTRPVRQMHFGVTTLKIEATEIRGPLV